MAVAARRGGASPPAAQPPKETGDWPRLAHEIDADEAVHVRNPLERCGWNQTRAALLDVSRMTLITKMEKYSIKTPGR